MLLIVTKTDVIRVDIRKLIHLVGLLASFSALKFLIAE